MIRDTYLITINVSYCYPKMWHKVIQIQIPALPLISKLLNFSEFQFPDLWNEGHTYKNFKKEKIIQKKSDKAQVQMASPLKSIKYLKNTNSLQIFPKNIRGGNTSKLILWDQYYSVTKIR